MLNYQNFTNDKNFKNAEEEYSKLQEKFLNSNESLDNISSKLIAKKEIVNNKEYEKQLLKKSLIEVQDEVVILKKLLEQKEKKHEATDYFFSIEKNKSQITNKNLDKKKQLESDKEKLKEFKSLSYSAITEKDKLVTQINQQNEKIYNIKNQISVYSSLGFKNTKKNILKNIKVDNDYQLAFYLALGDGIEASYDEEAPVIWNDISLQKPASLPEAVIPAYKYVEGPKQIQLFLSQVGIVNTNEQGNKHQKNLKPGQVLVSKNGELWRWDGLNIKDGKKL